MFSAITKKSGSNFLRPGVHDPFSSKQLKNSRSGALEDNNEVPRV